MIKLLKKFFRVLQKTSLKVKSYEQTSQDLLEVKSKVFWSCILNSEDNSESFWKTARKLSNLETDSKGRPTTDSSWTECFEYVFW